MNIKEAESQAGISRRNIRFYEQKGMLHPARNQDNDYRDYSPQDIERLKLIRALRMVDMSLEDIQKVLSGETSLEKAAKAQEKQLRDKAQEVQTAIRFCRTLSQVQAGADMDDLLRQMEQPENLSHLFSQWVEDYKQMRKAQDMAKFTLIPDEPVRTPQEFTAALRQYAQDNGLELVMLRESMNPEFTLDGVEYTAQRLYRSPRGILVPVATIIVTAMHPQQLLPPLEQPKGRVLRAVRYSWIGVVMVVLALMLALDQGWEGLTTLEGIAQVVGIPLVVGLGLFVTDKAVRKAPVPFNFKGQ